ncbi:MAG: YbbR-like domain-containing protein ['Candidatus Kapabacteria' thiocyanatum]|nr:YbbR-like domain-containing protein ['Candidatus Kapabacteria' thiocyanatum]
MAARRHSIGVLIFCMMLASLLWGYVSLNRMYEDDVELPLTVIPPPNQALLSTVPQRIVVRARATGLQLLNLKLFSRTSACTLDLGKMKPESQAMYRITKDDIVRSITTTQSMTTQSVRPSTMILATGDLTIRSLPVKLRYSVSTRQGFLMVGEPVVSPANVEVRGSGPILQSLKRWYTERVILTDVHEPVNTTIPVSDTMSTMLNVVPNTVHVRVNVQQLADQIVADVPVTMPPSLNKETSMVFPTHVKVILRGGVEDLARVSINDIQVALPEADKLLDGFVRPRVTVPAGTWSVGTIPPIVRYVERLPSAQ